MAKFYVTSGQVREIVVAEDATGAALEALDRFLEPSAWVFDDPSLSDTDCRAHLAIEVLLNLDSAMLVGQRGFQVCEQEMDVDAVQLSTAELLDTHFRLAVALRRFVAHFDRPAGCEELGCAAYLDETYLDEAFEALDFDPDMMDLGALGLTLVG